MRLLGVDPGLQATGFGVIDVDGPRLRYVASGVIRIPPGPLPPRLRIIHDGLHDVIAQYQPDESVIEIVFVSINPQSTLLLGQARGAAITALVTRDLPVHEYTALQVKKTVGGHGQAAKPQMQAMVQRLLSLPGLPSTDAADALACAICHASNMGMRAAVPTGAAAQLAAAATSRGSRTRRGRLR